MATHNLGFITASTVSPFLTGKGDELLAGGIEAAMKIADERLYLEGILLEVDEPWLGNDATEWGNQHEVDAIMRYEQSEFVTVHGQQDRCSERWLSCTPDGYVGPDGIVEVKCPFKTYVHRGYLLNPEALKANHYDQCQFQLMMTGRKWVDLCSYDPRWVEPLDLVVIRIEADKEWQVRCYSRIKQAEEIIQKTVESIKAKIKCLKP